MKTTAKTTLLARIKNQAIANLPLMQRFRDRDTSIVQPTFDRTSYELQEQSLFEFFKASWAVLEPGRKFYANWHQELICEYLELVTSGDIKRLLINMPPRHLKSSIVTIAWPCWEWIHHPQLRYLFLSYVARLSTKHNLKRRLLVQSNWYQKGWGDRFIMAGDNNLKTEFSNNHQGHMIATSFGGMATGEGGERLVIDDPHDPENAESDAQRPKTVDEFDDYSVTRLNDPETSAVVVVMQRLHEKDISGHIISDIGGYVHLCLPTEAEEKQIIVFPRSRRQVVRNEGDLLHPERFGLDSVEKAKCTLGSYKYAGRHQQRPVPREGGMILWAWFRRYRTLPEFDRIIQSWDTASKAKDLNCPWACTTWGEVNGNFYLLDCFCKRMEFPEGLATIRSLGYRWKPHAILIEDKGTGTSSMQQLGAEGFPYSLIPIQPQGDKVTRMASESPAIESGRVWLPEQADWLIDYERELTTFPASATADRVDSTSQFLNWIRTNSYSVLEVFKAFG